MLLPPHYPVWLISRKSSHLTLRTTILSKYCYYLPHFMGVPAVQEEQMMCGRVDIQIQACLRLKSHAIKNHSIPPP